MTNLPRPPSGFGDIFRFIRDLLQYLSEREDVISPNTLLSRTTRGTSRSALGGGEGTSDTATGLFKGQWVDGPYNEKEQVIRFNHDELDDGIVASTYEATADVITGDPAPGTTVTSATADAVIVGDGIDSATITDAGGAYRTAPAVTISGDGAGATAHCTLNTDGSIATIVIDTAGTGYTTATIAIDAATGTQKWRVMADGAWPKLTLRKGKRRIVIDTGRDAAADLGVTIFKDYDVPTAGSVQILVNDMIVAGAGDKVCKLRETWACDPDTGTTYHAMVLRSDYY